MSAAFSLAHDGSSRIDTDRIRQQHPIADVVNRYGIELRRSGSSLIGRCPFHVDRGRPNLTVYPRSGHYVCYRCGASGDAISFLQQLEHLTFREAASRLGAEPDLVRPARRVRPSAPKATHLSAPDASQLAVLSAALDLYRGRLLSDSSALDYLADRGFSRELVDQLHVGYAKGDELVHYLVWRNLPVTTARRVGLLEPDGSERLRGRIVFPEIRHGQPIWFIGRQLEPDDRVPKYLGLPGRKPLLGWESASSDLRGVAVVEGPLDLLAMRQWGVPGLALCGTRIHPETLSLLSRWNRLYLILDGDEAGREATEQLTDSLGQRAIPVQLPVGVKDPADLAHRPDGEALFRAAILNAVSRPQPATR
jgi:DNA primase